MRTENTVAEPQTGPTNRSFGLTVGGIFLVIEGLRYWHSQYVDALGYVLLGISIPLILGGLLAPSALTPLNKAWMKLGLVLHKIVNPVVMLIIYASAICTTGLILKILRKDPLRLKLDPDTKTYWIRRDPSDPAPETMKNQF